MIATSDRERVVHVGDIQVWIREPERITNGVVLHGRVLSKDGNRFYPIAKRRTGAGRYGYRCGCDGYVLAGRTCKHIAAFIVAERGEK